MSNAAQSSATNRATRAAVLCLLVTLCGCNTLSPLPPIDLTAPGWRTGEGQAVWRRNRRAPEIAGELIVAQHLDGRAWTQFSKPPLPFIMARIEPAGWEFGIVPQNRRWSAPGQPPNRLAWLQLLRCLQGQVPGHGWTWSRQADGHWNLDHPASGESLSGYLNP